ncbi:type IV toxin-antitoxin system AbiEi family antitoxin domain-containing protein [Nesterenkonia populi]
MEAARALKVLADVAASQWGLVTTAQARDQGVDRLTLSRLAAQGHYIRTEKGVYQSASAPPSEFDELRAAWLSLSPSLLAHERQASPSTDFIATGVSAAALHEIGDLRQERLQFDHYKRKQTQRPNLRLRKRTLALEQITTVHGLPCTRAEQTIADLLEELGDLSIVSTLVRDGIDSQKLDLWNLRLSLEPHAAAFGFDTGDDLLSHLRELSGRGPVATLERAIQQTAPNLTNLVPPIDLMAPVREALQQAVSAPQFSLPPSALEEAAKTIAANLDSERLVKNFLRAFREAATVHVISGSYALPSEPDEEGTDGSISHSRGRGPGNQTSSQEPGEGHEAEPG